MLIGALATTFEPDKFKNPFRERLGAQGDEPQLFTVEPNPWFETRDSGFQWLLFRARSATTRPRVTNFKGTTLFNCAGQLLTAVCDEWNSVAAFSASLPRGQGDSECISLGEPVVPISDSLDGRFAGVDGGQLRKGYGQAPTLPADQHMPSSTEDSFRPDPMPFR